MTSITLTRPDDWHLHLRDGQGLADVLPHTAAVFGRAICMPNLKPPVRTTAQAVAYRQRICAALPPGSTFTPLMTLYLTDATPPDEIAHAKASGVVHGVKLYPAGATTNSDAGVTDLRKVDAVLEAMAGEGMPLLVHGEVTDSAVDIFDREAAFIERQLRPLLMRHPRLRVVFEHLTTAEGVALVRRRSDDQVAATLTAHHLLLNRNAIFAGGLRPHRYCLPVLKRERHRRALLAAATSGDPRFFLGTDSAPHAIDRKEAACGCAGVYSASHALPLYAEAFASVDAIDRLEAFASFSGPDWYGLPRNTDTVTLVQAPCSVPARYPFRSGSVVPLRAGGVVSWSMRDS